MSIIKNVPPHTFGIAGNRGGSFPEAIVCAKLQQPDLGLSDVECWLVKEEDGYTSIFTDRNYVIGVDCVAPITAPCFIILEELDIDDTPILLGDDPLEEVLFFCDSPPAPDVCYISLQEDREIFLGQQENAHMLFCGEDVSPAEPETDICFIVLQEDRNVMLGQQEDGDMFFCNGNADICFIVIQEDRQTSLTQQENGDYILLKCSSAY